MNLNKLENLIEVVNKLLEMDGGADKATIAHFLQQMYGELVCQYRPVVHALPSVAGEFAKDLVPVVNTVLTIANEVRADESFQAAVALGRVQKAMMCKQALDSYMSAGFRREEAMALVLQDNANLKAHQHHVVKSASSSNKSS